MRKLNLTNQKFDRLTVLRCAGHQGKKVLWECQCECGKITYNCTNALTSGKSKSCGCLRTERLIKYSTKHNQRHTRIYELWKAMKNRCYNSNISCYKNYGGRGIKVCDEWKNDFQAFYNWSMDNGYNESLSIDRIDNNGNYEPSNCRWTDRTTQANNTRTNHYITFNGETKTLTQWAREYSLNVSCLRARIENGWSIEKALTTPPRK